MVAHRGRSTWSFVFSKRWTGVTISNDWSGCRIDVGRSQATQQAPAASGRGGDKEKGGELRVVAGGDLDELIDGVGQAVSLLGNGARGGVRWVRGDVPSVVSTVGPGPTACSVS